jgi:hypothetical protein
VIRLTLEDKLIEKPQSLYVLYKMDLEGIDYRLRTRIIDRAKENNFLISLGLIEFITTKRTHTIPTRLTKEGVEVCNNLKEQGIFSIFSDIPLDSESNFKSYYYEKLNSVKSQKIYEKSTFYNIFLQNIKKFNTPYKLTGIQIEFKSIKPLNIENGIEELWNFDLEFICKACNQKSHNIIVRLYKNNEKQTTFEIFCSECNAGYMICSFFECFYLLG